MKKLELLVCLTIASVSTVFAAVPAEMSVTEAVRYALDNNVSVINAGKNREIFIQKVKEYKAGVYPSLDWTTQYIRNIDNAANTLGYTKNSNWVNTLQLSQLIWAGGKVNAAIKIAELLSLGAEEEYAQARRATVKQVKSYYYDVLLASATVGIQQESYNISVQHLEQIEAQFKQGIKSDLNVLKQKVDVSAKAPVLIKARNSYETTMLGFKNALGHDPEDRVSLTEGFAIALSFPGELEALYEKAMKNRPELLIAELNYKSADENIRIAKAGFYPNITAYINRQLFGSVDSMFPGAGEREWSSVAGVTIKTPLFSGGETVSQTKQAELARDQYYQTLIETRRTVRIEVKNAWFDVREAQERIKSQTEAVSQARQAMTVTETRFKNGLSSQLELKDAELALNTAQMDYVQAMHDACVALVKLEWAVGQRQ